MSTVRVKVGIIGFGRWARVLTRAAQLSDKIEIASGRSLINAQSPVSP